MDWQQTWEGVPRVLAVVAAAAGSAVGALLIARIVRLDRLFVRLARPTLPCSEAQVRSLADLADAALREGMLGLESRTSQSGDDFLIRAVALAVEGTHPDEIRARMDAEIDAAAASPGARRRLTVRLSQVPQAAPMVGAAGLLGVMAAFGFDSASIGPAAAAGFLLMSAGLVAGATIGRIADRIAGRQAALILHRMLQTEAIASIRSGCDGRTVEAKLRAMLPAGSAEHKPVARAA